MPSFRMKQRLNYLSKTSSEQLLKAKKPNQLKKNKKVVYMRNKRSKFSL